MRLQNRADGVEGHYCVARTVPSNERLTEYWDDTKAGWSSFGTVYSCIESATSKLIDIANSKCDELSRLASNYHNTVDDLQRQLEKLRAGFREERQKNRPKHFCACEKCLDKHSRLAAEYDAETDRLCGITTWPNLPQYP